MVLSPAGIRDVHLDDFRAHPPRLFYGSFDGTAHRGIEARQEK